MAQAKGHAHKCIKKDGSYRKVSNDEAFQLVVHEGWNYIPRSLFKAAKAKSVKPKFNSPGYGRVEVKAAP